MLLVEASLHPYLLALGEAQPPRNRRLVLQTLWRGESPTQEGRSGEHSAASIQKVAHGKTMTSQ
jgi:hypothetical protein